MKDQPLSLRLLVAAAVILVTLAGVSTFVLSTFFGVFTIFSKAPAQLDWMMNSAAAMIAAALLALAAIFFGRRWMAVTAGLLFAASCIPTLFAGAFMQDLVAQACGAPGEPAEGCR